MSRHPIADVSPALLKAGRKEVRRRGLRYPDRRIKVVDGRTLELDLTTPDHVLDRRGR